MNKSYWPIALTVCVAFAAFTAWVIAHAGFGGLFALYEVNAWTVQLTADLVCALVAGLVFVAPRARRAGVGMAPFVVLTVLTGSIGFLALVARVLYREAVADSPSVVRGHASSSR